MRTTLNLPDDVYEAARSVADSRLISLGDPVAELVRPSLRSPVRITEDAGFPCFDVKPVGPPITLEHTRSIEDEL
ncbi:MAG: hypothetical protein ABI693_13015 [Bryobacteraceae bacterium]